MGDGRGGACLGVDTGVLRSSAPLPINSPDPPGTRSSAPACIPSPAVAPWCAVPTVRAPSAAGSPRQGGGTGRPKIRKGSLFGLSRAKATAAITREHPREVGGGGGVGAAAGSMIDEARSAGSVTPVLHFALPVLQCLCCRARMQNAKHAIANAKRERVGRDSQQGVTVDPRARGMDVGPPWRGPRGQRGGAAAPGATRRRSTRRAALCHQPPRGASPRLRRMPRSLRPAAPAFPEQAFVPSGRGGGGTPPGSPAERSAPRLRRFQLNAQKPDARQLRHAGQITVRLNSICSFGCFAFTFEMASRAAALFISVYPAAESIVHSPST